MSPEEKTTSIINRQARIIEQLDGSMGKLEEHTVEMIENLIAKLTNLKERVKLEKATAVERMTVLVSLSGSSLQVVKEIDVLTEKLERQVEQL